VSRDIPDAHVAAGEITALNHEVVDDAVEGGALVAETLGAGAQLLEVPGRPRDDVVIEREVDAAFLLCSTSQRKHVKGRTEATPRANGDIEQEGLRRTLNFAGRPVVLVENRALPLDVEKASLCKLRGRLKQKRPTYTLDMSADVTEKALAEIPTVDGTDGEMAEVN
jgi:hypothetical protein